jgi:hypothetical protein
VTAEHPSTDTIADYCAELLAPPAADALAAHLAECSPCTGEAAAIRHVSAVLAGDARRPLPMPEPVRLAIDDALRDESRSNAGSVVSRTDRRTPSALARTKGPLLSAAAAVVAVAGVTGGVRVIAGSGNDHPSALPTPQNVSSGGGTVATQGNPVSAAGGTPLQQPSGPLSAQSLPSYANRLTHAAPAQPRLDGRAQMGGCAVPHVPATDVMAVRRWHHVQAIVVVDPATRRVTVLDCDTAATVLYVTSY